MKVTRKTRLQTRAQNVFFVVLLLVVVALLGWLSTVYVVRADWTAGNRNTLAPASRKLVTTLHHPVTITAFATTNKALRRSIRELVGKYQRVNDNIRLTFVDPNVDPQKVRKLDIAVNGELVIHYQGRTEKVKQQSERALTNALARIARSSDRSVVFVTGHGELEPNGTGKLALSNFVSKLKDQGFKVDTVNLTATPSIPDNTSVLVIAGPRSNYLPGEVAIIGDYVKQGGNLLWLAQPGPRHGLKPLADMLGVTIFNGTIVDATAPLFGVQDVRWVVLNAYGTSPVTHDFQFNTLWPQTTAMTTSAKNGWHAMPFVKSRRLPRSWLETGKLEGKVSYDPKAGDKAGPLDIGVTLTRPLPKPPAQSGKKKVKAGARQTASASGDIDKVGDKATASTGKSASDTTATGKAGGNTVSRPAADGAQAIGGEQRVVVTGNADFLANAYLGYGGNLSLGLNLVNWLSHDDRYINIHPARAPDRTLALSPGVQQLIAWGFLVVLPLLLLAIGAWIWLRRRRY